MSTNKLMKLAALFFGSFICTVVLALVAIRVSIPHYMEYFDRVPILTQAIYEYSTANGIPVPQDKYKITYSTGWSQDVHMRYLKTDPRCSGWCDKSIRADPDEFSWSNPVPVQNPYTSIGSGGGGGGADYDVIVDGYWRTGTCNDVPCGSMFMVTGFTVVSKFRPGTYVWGGW